jgi:hypothetical protein
MIELDNNRLLDVSELEQTTHQYIRERQKKSSVSLKVLDRIIEFGEHPGIWIQIGGSTTRIFTVTNVSTIVHIRTTTTPLLDSAERLLDHIQACLQTDLQYMYISLAFEMEIELGQNSFKPFLIRGGKGHTLSDLIGKDLQKNVSDMVITRNPQIKNCFVLNDLFFDAYEKWKLQRCKTFLIGVVGTGFNLGVVDDNICTIIEPANIKLSIQHSTSKISIEEYISGKYLFMRYNELVLTRQHQKIVSTSELTQIYSQDEYAQAVIILSCSLVGMVISAVMDFHNVAEAMCFMDGSVFWDSNVKYEETTKQYLLQTHKKTVNFKKSR